MSAYVGMGKLENVAESLARNRDFLDWIESATWMDVRKIHTVCERWEVGVRSKRYRKYLYGVHSSNIGVGRTS